MVGSGSYVGGLVVVLVVVVVVFCQKGGCGGGGFVKKVVVVVVVVVFVDEEVAATTIKQFQEQAFSIVDQSTTFLVEAKDEPANVELLRSIIRSFDLPSQPANGNNKTYDIGVYDCKLAGESVTHPHLRSCNWRAQHYEKMTRSFLRALLPEDHDVITKDNVPGSTMVLVFDGSRTFGRFCRTQIIQNLKTVDLYVFR